MGLAVHIVDSDTKLKLLMLNDSENLFGVIDSSRDYLRQWLPWVDSTKTIEDSRSYIQFALNQLTSNHGFQFGIWWKDQLVGCVGLHSTDWVNRKTNIGYWIGESFQGKGIMTKVVRTLVDLAFVQYGLNRVEIRAAFGNHKSRAIPERLGFTNEGRIQEAQWVNDHFVDHIVYGMLAAQRKAE